MSALELNILKLLEIKSNGVLEHSIYSMYSSPPLIRIPRSAKQFCMFLVEEVSFGERTHHKHSVLAAKNLCPF